MSSADIYIEVRGLGFKVRGAKGPSADASVAATFDDCATFEGQKLRVVPSC